MNRVSFCLIVKDAEDSILQCINSIHGVADEIIVVDTGSTDKTLELIKDYSKIRLFHQEWQDDFSQARNTSFSKATGDLLIWIDADDILPEPSSYEIDFLKFQSLEHITDAYTCPYQYGNDSQGIPDLTFDSIRVIKRTCFNKWIYKIHEQLDLSLVKTIQNLNIQVTHTKKTKDFQRSLDRNIRILERIVSQEESEAVYDFLYARELYFKKDFVTAQNFFELFISKMETQYQPSLSFYLYFSYTKLAYFAVKKEDKGVLKDYLQKIKKLKFPQNYEVLYLEASLLALQSTTKGTRSFKNLILTDEPQLKLFLSRKEVLYFSRIEPLKKLISLLKENGLADEAKGYSEQLLKII